MKHLEVLFSPAEHLSLPGRDLSGTSCVVLDVLRATSTILEALAQGATAIRPVAEIEEALEWRRKDPRVLLAGERNGLRIDAHQAGGVAFDLGNSPREFERSRVEDRTIVMTTPNGTRALRACAAAARVWVTALTNVAATARRLEKDPTPSVLLVCSGTGEQAAYEDLLGAGALVDRILERHPRLEAGDSAHAARAIFRAGRADLLGAVQHASNARRLLAIPALAEDVAACLELDRHAIAAQLTPDGLVKRV